MTDRLQVDLTGAPQTMLATLYGKALDADLPNSVLHDTYARDVVARIDYDWSRTTMTAARSPGVTLRSAYFDMTARQFLAVHPDAVVLHLGCGLDSRYYRLDPGPDVDWYDVDYPEVADLRRQLYPPREHCHIVSASVTDPAWLADIPADRPVLMLAEGLTMYLSEADGQALFRRIVEQFPSGELQFDAFSRLGVKLQWTNSVVRRSGATLQWAMDSPDDVLSVVPGLRLLSLVSAFDADGYDRLPAGLRVMAAIMRAVPGMRYMSQYHRYSWG
ncbi:class I SAM-dependent methyltransferase [Mycolicibacterium mucogenicum]|uniref:class I SAM-dependent methyltransferase n=1 Tax=Mycolicibacterium TaxID=1866885 RepID=UPI00226AB9E8|nr:MULTISPECIES: class I SAM-dependent methyltransferase [Mycolicibacterium]MCX8564228.1 class I SAM-dependent methyltransferase [Mycolicibacterium mucogenicum]